MKPHNTIPQIIELINKVSDFLAIQQQIKQTEVAQLLIETTPHVERLQKTNKENAFKFNVFSALGVTRKEVVQSRFLTYLLDPNENHCQDSLFLDCFLEKIGLPTIREIEQTKRIQVSTEHWAGEYIGRMDIVLTCQPDWLLVIENKIGAGEGSEQLARYKKWLCT
jgi:hypothetical protein